VQEMVDELWSVCYREKETGTAAAFIFMAQHGCFLLASLVDFCSRLLLKTHSLQQSYCHRWLQRLDGPAIEPNFEM
jgi:hypothetical protein